MLCAPFRALHRHRAMSQDTRPSGEPSPGDMDHFNSEVYGELVSMRELQAKLGLCMRNQEAIHQRLDAMCTGTNEIVEQLNAHKASWSSLATWIQETSRDLHDLELSVQKAEGDLDQMKTSSAERDVVMGRAHKCLWKAVGELQEAENDKEIERRANNA